MSQPQPEIRVIALPNSSVQVIIGEGTDFVLNLEQARDLYRKLRHEADVAESAPQEGATDG